MQTAELFQDFRYAFRQLGKSPGFAGAAILTLALGIAATAVLFSILDGAYIHFGQTEQANRAVLLTQRFGKLNSDSSRFSPAEYFDIAGLHGSFDGFFALRHFNPTLTETEGRTENPERVPAIRATADIFRLYGIAPIFGRVFTTVDDRPGGDNVVVVTYRLWNRRFGHNPAIVGKVIQLDGVSYTVIGVTPRRFQQWGADVLIPLQLDPAQRGRSERTLTVAGIPKRGVSTKQTEGELELLARRVEAEYGSAHPEYAGLTYVPFDIRSAVVGDLRTALYILLGSAALLLLIASANIANLLLARVMSRAGEIGVRLALGGTPARVARQFLTEGVVLGAVAGVLGFALGIAALNSILTLIPAFYIGEEAEIHASPTAFLVSISIALLLGAAFGLVSVLFVARRGVRDNLLRQGTRSVTDRRGGRVRSLLVFSEMALAFVVVVGAGLMVRTYQQLTSFDFGFRPDHVLTMRIALPELKYPSGAEVRGFSQELLRRTSGLPGVTDAALSSILPMEGEASRDFSIPGRSLSGAGGLATAAYRVVTPGYFRTIGTPLRGGRFFEEVDGPGNPGVALVNESFARTWFPNEDAVGKSMQLHNLNAREGVNSEESANDSVQVVGVVKDSRQDVSRHLQDLYTTPSPEIYVPFSQHAAASRDMALLLRTATDPGALTDGVRAQVLRIDSGQPVYDVQTLQGLTDVALGPARLALVLLGAFAGIALLIASVGLYALVAYSVAQRTREIGIRMAMGARREDVLHLVVQEGMALALSGLALGLAASLGLTRLMSTLLYGVHPNDSATLAVVSTVLIGIAIVASYIPARRAANVDPIVALRYE
jgi:putative ABC transport system permease protein